MKKLLALTLGLLALPAALAQEPPKVEGRLQETAAAAPAVPALYGSLGVAPLAVTQGRLGSCYFHASIAALAGSHPEVLQSELVETKPGEYTVTFANGKTEHVYAVDAIYAQTSDYDKSDGLWVAVLFRAYAQRQLRHALIKAVDNTQMYALAKRAATALISSSDRILVAYDRAIRQVIDQKGDIDKAKLKDNLMQQLAGVPISDDAKARIVDMVDQKGYFDSLAQDVKDDGDIFGGYRAVGHGGQVRRVLEAFYKPTESKKVDDVNALAVLLRKTVRLGQPVLASTEESGGDAQSAENFDKWFVPLHAYTVLAYDPTGQSVTVRNPWGRHPDPDGEFTLPLQTFHDAFPWLYYPKPVQQQQ